MAAVGFRPLFFFAANALPAFAFFDNAVKL